MFNNKSSSESIADGFVYWYKICIIIVVVKIVVIIIVVIIIVFDISYLGISSQTFFLISCITVTLKYC